MKLLIGLGLLVMAVWAASKLSEKRILHHRNWEDHDDYGC